MNRNQKTNQNYQEWNTVRELDITPRERSNVYIGVASFIILIGAFVLEGIVQGLELPILDWALVIMMFFVIRRTYQEGIAQGRARVLEDMEENKEKEVTRKAESGKENKSMVRDNNENHNQNPATNSPNNQTMNYDPQTGEKLR